MAVSQKLSELAERIEQYFDLPKPPADVDAYLEVVLSGLESGEITVVERLEGSGEGKSRWKVNSWIKKAILLYLRVMPVRKMPEGNFYDKIPLQSVSPNQNRLAPFATLRRGAYLGPKVLVMAPSFINIGAYIDESTMVDSLVVVGSCARVGKNVHLGASTVIGGVLEPPNSTPVIVEDNAFVGGNCGIYEGCIVETNAVIGAGTIITASTPIIDINTGEEFMGRVPANSVVVPGGRPKKIGNQEYILQTPLIIKKRNPNLDAKLALEESLRTFS